MSYSSWKFLNHLKDLLSKYASDKSPHQVDFFQILNKTPPSYDIGEYVKSAEKRISAMQQSVQNLYNAAVESPTGSDKNKQKKNSLVEKDWKNIKRISQSERSLDISNISGILSRIQQASTEEEILRVVEYLIAHLKEHPNVRNNAIQKGAIRILLNKHKKALSQTAKGAMREALTILGYHNPVAGRGIRILSIDGGGIRGVLVLEMLKKLEELTGKRTYELFDFFCGVSTGAILTYSMGIHLRKLEDIITRYENLSQEIFNQSRFLGTGKLMWSHAYYDTALWEKKLEEYLGNESLISTSRNSQCPKICVVSAVVNQSQVSAYAFRNYALPWRFQSEYDGTYDAKVWQAARASAAAPTYFEEFRIGDHIHQDGAILVNNPTAIAIHEAKLIWPNTPIQCVVSFGTGRSIPSPAELGKQTTVDNTVGSEGTSWTNKFYKILDSATDTQAVHIMLSDLLPDDVYYRFNPYLTELIGIVETDKEKQRQIKRDALMYLRRNEDKFQQAAKTLTLSKSYGQKFRDKVNYQRELLGV
ncbi:calcium-independent phospholipase A2-gamma-like isoform X2 [Anthonomus grandis grandis]|nr:calcium-independent phospholipase A2-gamma-like isoform X2 [Anthonomus grandis grandis]XP_050297535.1 calcium-independent phospholipase A2-gamma-like isoform X2 [Anthonomus grandis grandis]